MTSIVNDINLCIGDTVTVGPNQYTDSGNYIDTLVSLSGCDSLVYTNITVIELNVVINNAGIAIEAVCTGGLAPYFFNWNTSESSQIIFPQTNGLYWVFVVTDQYGCSSDTAFFEVEFVPNSISESVTELNIYPNPTNGKVTISFASDYGRDYNIRIINILGDQLFIDELNTFVGEYKQTVNLASYPKGIYFLEIETDVGVINKKLILQ